jgi:SPP1 family predicted phage head-tail adaptor
MARDPSLAAGDLDRRVTLLQPLYNEFEDEIVAWNPAATVWAAVNPTFGMETNEAGRETVNVLVSVVIRYRSDVDHRWRIQDGPHLYDITGITDITRRRVQLTMSCQEVL